MTNSVPTKRGNSKPHKFVQAGNDIVCEKCGLIILSSRIPTQHETMLENRKEAKKECPNA